MKKMTYEEAFSSLEELVAKLEKGDMPLEETTKIYADAVKLADFCSQTLEKSRIKIEKLTEGHEENSHNE